MDKIAKKNPIQLMILAKDGNKDAFGELYEMYFVPIFRYIYYRVKNKQQAEDMTQTVFLKIYRSIKNYENREVAPLALFYTVAKNLLTDHWRKKKDTILAPDSLNRLSDSQQNDSNEIEKIEIRESVHQAIALLKKDQQEVIILKFINELSNREIAEIIDKKETAVRQIQCRGLKKLSEYF
tara:strand:+ start:1491 stop:2033 length:543 start_codon:yes stop_codon:yes gene_type:complete